MNKTSAPDQQKLHEFAACIKARRTINFFKAGEVSDAFMYDAIEVARWAPNHKKTEPWEFHLLGPVTQAKIKDLIVEIKAAGQGDNVRKSIKERVDAIPGWLVISCDVSNDQITQFEDYAACACAAQNMMLYLWQAGIGMKWTTGKVIRDQRFFDLLKIDITQKIIVGLFWYGYPQQCPEQTRKPLTDISKKHK